jgi:hypothetical protein
MREASAVGACGGLGASANGDDDAVMGDCDPIDGDAGGKQ